MFSRTHVPRLVSTWLRWHVIPLLFLFPLFLAPAAVIEGDNAGVLRNAVLQNTAARQRVQSYIINQERSDLEPYQVDRPFDASAAADGLPAGPPPEDITRTSSMKIIKKGERYLLTRTQHATVPSGKWEMREFYQEVLNDHYYAFYMREPLHLIDLWDHPSIGIMGDPAKRFSSSGCPTAFDYAFGEPSHTLDKLLDESPEDVRWSLTEETLDGDKVLKIVKTRPIKDGRKWITNFYLDPNKDSLLRRMELFSPKGTLNRLLTLELQYIEEAKAWFPKEIHYKDTPDGQLQSEIKISVKNVQINPSLDDSLLRVESFDLLPNTRLHRHGAQGGLTEYRFVNGQWVQ